MELQLKTILIIIAVIAASVAAVWGQLFLTKKKSVFIGLIIPFAIYVAQFITFFVMLGKKVSFEKSIITFFIINFVMIVSLVAFVIFRARRYKLLLAEMNKKNKQIAARRIDAEKKAHLLHQLNGFRCAECELDIDIQRDIVIEKYNNNKTVEQICAALECSENDVNAVLASFERYSRRIDTEESSADIILSPEQEERYITTIINSLPEKIGFSPESHWSKNSVRTLVSNDCNSNVSLRFISAYLRHWGFSIPASQTLKVRRELPEVALWLERSFEDIRKMASAVSGEIVWVYTVNLESVKEMTKYVGENPFMICAVTNDGSMRFKVYDDKSKANSFKDFVSSVISSSSCKLFAVINEKYDEYINVLGKDTVNAVSDRIEFFKAP